ncbi:unnamed protein product [Rhodiola kirilowii]
MEIFREARMVRLRSHHDKYLVADENEEFVSQERDGNSQRAKWRVEFVNGSNVIRLKSCYGKYLTASDSCLYLRLIGKKVIQTFPRKLDSSVEWEPIREGVQVKLRSRYGYFLRANGGIPPWRNSITHNIPRRSATQDWILWEVEVVQQMEEEDAQTQQESIGAWHWSHPISRSTSSCSESEIFMSAHPSPMHSPNTSPRTFPKESPNMFSTISLESSPNMSPRTSPKQSHNMSPKFYLNLPPKMSPKALPYVSPKFYLNLSSKMSPKDLPDMSPNPYPNLSPKMSPKALPNMSPNLYPNLSPKMSPKVLPSMSVRTSPNLSPKMSPKVLPSVSVRTAPNLSRKVSPKVLTNMSVRTSPRLSPEVSARTSQNLSANMSSRMSLRHQISEGLMGNPMPMKSEGRLIWYKVAGENFAEMDETLPEGKSFHFKGTEVEELRSKLAEETGLVDKGFIMCSRNPFNGRLYPLKLDLPPNDAPMNLFVVPSSSEVAKEIATWDSP